MLVFDILDLCCEKSLLPKVYFGGHLLYGPGNSPHSSQNFSGKVSGKKYLPKSDLEKNPPKGFQRENPPKGNREKISASPGPGTRPRRSRKCLLKKKVRGFAGTGGFAGKGADGFFVFFQKPFPDLSWLGFWLEWGGSSGENRDRIAWGSMPVCINACIPLCMDADARLRMYASMWTCITV